MRVQLGSDTCLPRSVWDMSRCVSCNQLLVLSDSSFENPKATSDSLTSTTHWWERIRCLTSGVSVTF